MKFSFSLAAVLKYREQLEDQAQQEYLEARRAVDQLLAEINGMYAQIDDTRAQIHNDTLRGNSADKIDSLNEFIDGQKIRIERARLKARELLAVADEKHDALVAASREKKALEELKEKRFEEFKKVQKKKDLKNTDEIVTIRFRHEE